MSFTDLPQDYNPWEAAAARVRARYPVREPDPTAAAASNMPAGQMWGALAGGAAQSAATLPERAFQSAGSLQYGGSYDPGPILEAAMLPMAGTSFSAPYGALGAGPIRAYHGSPYDFERFDMSKIGTGEGAQAYGHGLYFAENPAVAQSYRDALTRAIPGNFAGYSKYTVGGSAPPAGISGHKALDTFQDIDALMQHMVFEREAAKSQFGYPSGMPKFLREKIENRLENWRKEDAQGWHTGSAGEDMRALADWYDKNLKNAKPEDLELSRPGKMYEVNIRADPEEFLNWDKPLSQQSPEVRSAYSKIFGEPDPKLAELRVRETDELMHALAGDRDPVTNVMRREADWHKLARERDKAWQEWSRAQSGQAAYADLERRYGRGSLTTGKPIASEALREAGIPGIRYLDQGSRLTGGVTKLGDNWFVKGSSAPYKTEAEAIAAAEKSGGRTSNYVLFRDDIIDILRKYGLAGGMAGSALPYALAPTSGEMRQ